MQQIKTLCLLALLFAGSRAIGICQDADPGSKLNALLAKKTAGRLRLNFEIRAREEARTGNNFGKSASLENALVRTRIGASFRVANWLSVSATGQESRAPYYGRVSPSSIRDTMDLLEGYLDFFGNHETGFSGEAGRKMLSYGDGRLIGTPDWSNLSRSYDNAHVSYRFGKNELQVLVVSPVKILSDSFNHPNLGDRVIGTYDSFADLIPNLGFDGYILRHDQNAIGGFTAPGRLGTVSYGSRAVVKLPYEVKVNGELALQSGHLGQKDHTGSAWVSGISRPLMKGIIPIELFVEYKAASGTKTPGTAKESTFDQLYAANHDRFGQTDLFGWKNIRNFRVLNTVRVTKGFTLNLMYNNWWLDSASDSLYNSGGSSIAVSAKGTAGTHVGQEADVFGVFRFGHYKFGLGFAHVFAGEFLKATTPGVNTRYLYLSQGYSF